MAEGNVIHNAQFEIAEFVRYDGRSIGQTMISRIDARYRHRNSLPGAIKDSLTGRGSAGDPCQRRVSPETTATKKKEYS